MLSTLFSPSETLLLAGSEKERLLLSTLFSPSETEGLHQAQTHRADFPHYLVLLKQDFTKASKT